MPMRHCRATMVPLTGCKSASVINIPLGSSTAMCTHMSGLNRYSIQKAADNRHHDVGGEIVGTVVIKLLAAVGAGIRDLKISAEHVPGAALWAAAMPSQAQVLE